MPRADYRCLSCGAIEADVVFPIEIGARGVERMLTCTACGGALAWIPACRFDLTTDGEGGRAGQKFTVHRQVPTRDGLVQVEEVIDSAHARRRIERDAEQRYRDGEGEPIRFRMDHQSASNRDVNSFGSEGRIGDRTYDSGWAPQKKSNIGVTRHGQVKPRIPLGPGLRRAGSPLKD